MDALIVNNNNSIQSQTIGADLFSNWVNYLDRSDKTVQTYTRAIKQFLDYLQENGIAQPTRQDVIDYKNSLLADHKATTVQNYIMAVKQFFNWTELTGLYPNIAKHISTVEVDHSEFKKDYLTSEQVKRLLETSDRATLKGKRNYAMFSLMATCGLRTIEVVRANVEDIKPKADFTALYIQGKGKQTKAKYVKLESHTETAIREYLQARGAKDGEPLFTSLAHRNSGERLTTRSISREVKENLKEAGLNSDRLTAHSLRHTTAVLNLLNGGTLEETSVLLRHSSTAITRIYSHAIERDSNRSEERVGKAIFG